MCGGEGMLYNPIMHQRDRESDVTELSWVEKEEAEKKWLESNPFKAGVSLS